MKNLFQTLFLSIVFCWSFLILQAHPAAIDIKADEQAAIIGKWDMTIYDGDRKMPSWLEISHSGSKWLFGRYVGVVGSVRPISVIHFQDGKLDFTLPPQWESEDRYLTFEGTLDGDKMSGTMVAANGKTYKWSAVRAPLLLRKDEPVWDKSITLFDGKDIKGWKSLGADQWVVENGVLKSPHSGANLITDSKFEDFKLHIEFRCPSGSNSGVYLRGRYEVQIVDSHGQQPDPLLMGAVYGFITPSEMATKGPDKWQSYDITLIGRRITVVLNGKKIICDRPIPGITGGALDSNEGEPGPIYLQGDHGPIEFRNIVLTPARKL